MTIMPAAFFGHGNPMNALERNRYTEAWRAFGRSVPRPRAILVVSGPTVSPSAGPSTAGRTSAPGRPNASSAPAVAPATSPDAPPTDLAPPPVIDPVGCRPVD